MISTHVCTRYFGLYSEIGAFCPDCRHPGLVHPGRPNPDMQVCLLCYLQEQAEFFERARNPLIPVLSVEHLTQAQMREGYDSAVDDIDKLTTRLQTAEELLAAIWLYVNWRSVTGKLTTEQRELWADAIEAQSGRDHPGDPTRPERWWRDDSPTA